MTRHVAKQFTDALRTMERERNLQPITDMFAKDATMRRIPRSSTYEGPRAVHQFWEEYLDAFSSITTEFTNVIEAGKTVVLEWHSKGQTKHGKEVHYEGVSVLELSDDGIRVFRTYYDAAASGLGVAVAPDADAERVGPGTTEMIQPIQEAG